MQGIALAGTGTLIGLAGGLVLGQAISSVLYQVGATDPPTYATVTLALAAVACLASYVPARRAMNLNPMETLRHE